MKRRKLLRGWAGMACAMTVTSLESPALAALTADRDASDGKPDSGFLPLFPLPVVAFPAELVFLHIYEPRYKQLIRECADDGITFGIATLLQDVLARYGTEVKLERILRTDADGELDIAIRGVRVFRLHELHGEVQGKLYSGATVKFQRNDASTESGTQEKLVRLYNRVHGLLGSGKKIAGEPGENLSFLIGHDTGLSLEQELVLLAMRNEADRQRFLVEHLDKELERLERRADRNPGISAGYPHESARGSQDGSLLADLFSQRG